jgi:hypothetical protein
MTDVRVRHEKDLEDIVGMKLLVGIPHLEVPGEDRSRIRLRRIEMSAAVIMAILVVLGNVFAFYKS